MNFRRLNDSRVWRWDFRSWVVSLLSLLPLLMGCVAKAGDAEAATRKRGNAVLSGLLAERQKFKSGVAVISGKLTRDGPDRKLKGPIAGLYAFELDGDKLRYDYAAPQYVRNLNSRILKNVKKGELRKKIDEIPPTLFRRRLCYLRNREYSAYWTHDGPNTRGDLILLKPDAKLGMVPRIYHMHDVRAAGMMDYSDFDSHRSFTQVMDRFPELAVSGVTEEQDRVVLEMGTSRLVVETRDGFRPIELTRTPTRGTTRSVSKARWERRGMIDVPVELTIQQEDSEHRYNFEYKLKYDWKSVNERVDPAYFDYHTFQGIPDELRVSVYDSREPKTLKVKEWTSKDELSLPHHKESSAPPTGKAIPVPGAAE